MNGAVDGLAEIEVGDALGERTPPGGPARRVNRGRRGPPGHSVIQEGRDYAHQGMERMPKGSCFRLVACRRVGRPIGRGVRDAQKGREQPGFRVEHIDVNP